MTRSRQSRSTDLLLVTASESRPRRVQGAWVDEGCVRQVVSHWKRQAGEPQYVEGIAEDTSSGGGGGCRQTGALQE